MAALNQGISVDSLVSFYRMINVDQRQKCMRVDLNDAADTLAPLLSKPVKPSDATLEKNSDYGRNHSNYLQKYKFSAALENQPSQTRFTDLEDGFSPADSSKHSLLQLPADVLLHLLSFVKMDTAADNGYRDLFAFGLSCPSAWRGVKPILAQELTKIHTWGGDRIAITRGASKLFTYPKTLSLNDEERHEIEAPTHFRYRDRSWNYRSLTQWAHGEKCPTFDPFRQPYYADC